MLKIGDTVLYGAMGVCRVEARERIKFERERKEYYILKSVNQPDSVFYVPTDNEELLSKVQDVLTVDQIFETIREAITSEDIWVDDDNERRIAFGEIVGNGDRKELMVLVRSLYHHKTKQEQIGKKFHAADERCLKDATRLLHDEFSYVLNIEPDEIAPYIEEQIQLINAEN